MEMNERIKKAVAAVFRIDQQANISITINEPMNHQLNVFKNQLWYRGDASELHQFYQLFDDMCGNTKFWRASATTGVHFRKIHTGLPALIVDRLRDIVVDDMNEFEFSTDNTKKKQWEKMTSEYNFNSLIGDAIATTLWAGDGAFKISMDPETSQYPIVEFYGADRVEFEKKRGRLETIIFKTERLKKGKRFILHEFYGRHGVHYKLFDGDGREVTVPEIEDFSDLLPVMYSNDLVMAVPLIFEKSPKYEGRGKSIFDTKVDSFDSYDEVWSQWMEALRDNRVTRYIPDNLLPKDVNNNLLQPNSFDNRYIKTESQSNKENAVDKITIEGGNLQADGLLATYVTALDLCLQGLISPSTLGIDVKKLDNAESQREKEKATLYTRNRIIKALEVAIPQLVNAMFGTIDTLDQKELNPVDVTVSWGEYANPSFEAVVDTVGKAKQYGIMSTYRSVKEMYGDSMSDEEVLAEVGRIQAESGVMDATQTTLPDTGTDAPAAVSTLNGAQITSLLKVTEQVKAGSISHDGAISLLTSTLGLSKENAESILQEQIAAA